MRQGYQAVPGALHRALAAQEKALEWMERAMDMTRRIADLEAENRALEAARDQAIFERNSFNTKSGISEADAKEWERIADQRLKILATLEIERDTARAEAEEYRKSADRRFELLAAVEGELEAARSDRDKALLGEQAALEACVKARAASQPAANGNEADPPKLEVGKTYLSREGVLVRITVWRWGHTDYPAIGDSGYTYTENGRFVSGGTDPLDLIAEAPANDARKGDVA